MPAFVHPFSLNSAASVLACAESFDAPSGASAARRRAGIATRRRRFRSLASAPARTSCDERTTATCHSTLVRDDRSAPARMLRCVQHNIDQGLADCDLQNFERCITSDTNGIIVSAMNCQYLLFKAPELGATAQFQTGVTGPAGFRQSGRHRRLRDDSSSARRGEQHERPQKSSGQRRSGKLWPNGYGRAPGTLRDVCAAAEPSICHMEALNGTRHHHSTRDEIGQAPRGRDAVERQMEGSGGDRGGSRGTVDVTRLTSPGSRSDALDVTSPGEGVRLDLRSNLRKLPGRGPQV